MTASKPYELSVEQRPSYLYAHVKSTCSTPKMSLEYLTDITEKCREAQCNKIVIDNEVPKAFWVWDIFSVAVRFPWMGRGCTKVAIVDRFADPIENEEFTVLVGHKCGVDVHVFNNLAEAVCWIIG